MRRSALRYSLTVETFCELAALIDMQCNGSSIPSHERGEVWRLYRGFRQMPAEDQTILRRWFSIPDTAGAFEACEVIEAAAPAQVRDTIKFLGPEALRTRSVQ